MNSDDTPVTGKTPATETRMQRWSRLKTDERREDADNDELIAPDETSDLPIDAQNPEQTTEEIVASLPDIDSLEKDSDFTGFMRVGVPEELKNLALRKLWLSDPVLANVDGLNDYDDDFNVIDKVLDIAADALDKFSQTEEPTGTTDDEQAKPVETENLVTANGEEKTEIEKMHQNQPHADGGIIQDADPVVSENIVVEKEN